MLGHPNLPKVLGISVNNNLPFRTLSHEEWAGWDCRERLGRGGRKEGEEMQLVWGRREGADAFVIVQL